MTLVQKITAPNTGKTRSTKNTKVKRRRKNAKKEKTVAQRRSPTERFKTGMTQSLYIAEVVLVCDIGRITLIFVLVKQYSAIFWLVNSLFICGFQWEEKEKKEKEKIQRC